MKQDRKKKRGLELGIVMVQESRDWIAYSVYSVPPGRSFRNSLFAGQGLRKFYGEGVPMARKR